MCSTCSQLNREVFQVRKKYKHYSTPHERVRQYLLTGRKRRKSGRIPAKVDKNGELDETCRPKNSRTHKAKKLKAKKQDESKVEEIADDASDDVSDSSDSDIDLSK